MIRSDMITAVRDLVGDPDGTQFTENQIGTYLNWGMDQITIELGLNQKETTLAALAGSGLIGGVDLPADFIREVQVRWNGTRLQRMSWRDLYPQGDNLVLSSTAGAPTHYAVAPFTSSSGAAGIRRLAFWPYQPLTQAATINLQYMARVAYMIANPDTCTLPVELHELVVLYGVRYCKVQEGDHEAARFISGDIGRRMMFARDLLNEHDIHTNPEVGGDGETLYAYDD